MCKSRHLQLAGGARPLSAANPMNPMMSPMSGYMSPRISSPAHPGSGGGGVGRSPLVGTQRGGRDRADLELIGKTIKITQGTYKGYIGIVKDSVGTTARVELHSQCQTITVDKSRIDIVGANTGRPTGSLSSYGKTPSYGAQTPMYHGSRTPLYGSQTPMHDGSRTPAYGSQTPLHDPSRTPLHSSSWDPSSSQTPRADFEDFDNPSPSPNPNYLNPPTPGYRNPDTPEGGPYTPQTPGMYASGTDNLYSPYQPSPSPSGSYAAPSPATPYIPPSPGYAGPSSVAAPSPSYYNPMTPGVTSPMFTPATPGAGLEPMIQGDWPTLDIEVQIVSGDDQALIGQTGIIRGTSGGMCSVYLPREDRVVTILTEHLQPVPPTQGKRVSSHA